MHGLEPRADDRARDVVPDGVARARGSRTHQRSSSPRSPVLKTGTATGPHPLSPPLYGHMLPASSPPMPGGPTPGCGPARHVACRGNHTRSPACPVTMAVRPRHSPPCGVATCADANTMYAPSPADGSAAPACGRHGASPAGSGDARARAACGWRDAYADARDTMSTSMSERFMPRMMRRWTGCCVDLAGWIHRICAPVIDHGMSVARRRRTW